MSTDGNDAEEGDVWMTLAEAADYIGMSTKYVRARCKDGSLRHTRTPRYYRMRRSWLDEFLEGQGAS